MDASTGIAANLSDLSAMAHDGKILNITFNNTSPSVSIDRASVSGSLADTVTLLRSIKSNYSLNVRNLSASEAASVNTLASNAKTTFTIKDDAANVTSSLATFQTYAQSKKLTSITLNDQTTEQKKQMLFNGVTTAGRNPYSNTTVFPSFVSTYPNLLAVNATQLTSAKTALTLLAPGSVKIVVANSSTSTLNNTISDKRVVAFTLTDTGANINKNMGILASAIKDRLIYVNPKDSTPITMTEDQFKSLMLKEGSNLGMPSDQVINITNAKASDASYLKGFLDEPGWRKMGTVSVSDSLSNILTNLDDLETAVKNGVVTDIKVTDASKGSISMAKFNADLDALKKISNTFNLGITDLSAADAKSVKSPSNFAKLTLSVADTSANIIKNLNDLNTLAKAKTLTSVTDTDGGVFTLNKSQYDASQALLNTIKLSDGTDGYRLDLTNFTVSDAAKVASNTHLYKMSISDTTKRILSGWSTVQQLSDNRKIAGLVCNELANTTLSIQDAYKINGVYQASLPYTYTIADTARNLISQQNLDLSSILVNAKSVNVTDKTTPNLQISQAQTLTSISNLSGTPQYNIVDSADNISAADGDPVLANAKSVAAIDPVTVDQAKAMLTIDPTAKYAIADSVDALIAEGSQDKGGMLAKGVYVNIKDTATNVCLHFDAVKSLFDQGYISNTVTTEMSDSLPMTAQQVFSGYQVLGSVTNISTSNFSKFQAYGKNTIISEQKGFVYAKMNTPYFSLGSGFASTYGRSQSGITEDGYLEVTGTEKGYFTVQANIGSDAQQKRQALAMVDALSNATSASEVLNIFNEAKSNNVNFQIKYELTDPADINGDGSAEQYNHVELDPNPISNQNGTITLNPKKPNWIGASVDQPFLGRPTGETKIYNSSQGISGDPYTVTGNEIGNVKIGVNIPSTFTDIRTLEGLISKVTSAPTPGAFQTAWNNLQAVSDGPDKPSFSLGFDLNDPIELPGKGLSSFWWGYKVINGHLSL